MKDETAMDNFLNHPPSSFWDEVDKEVEESTEPAAEQQVHTTKPSNEFDEAHEKDIDDTLRTTYHVLELLSELANKSSIASPITRKGAKSSNLKGKLANARYKVGEVFQIGVWRLKHIAARLNVFFRSKAQDQASKPALMSAFLVLSEKETVMEEGLQLIQEWLADPNFPKEFHLKTKKSVVTRRIDDYLRGSHSKEHIHRLRNLVKDLKSALISYDIIVENPNKMSGGLYHQIVEEIIAHFHEEQAKAMLESQMADDGSYKMYSTNRKTGKTKELIKGSVPMCEEIIEASVAKYCETRREGEKPLSSLDSFKNTYFGMMVNYLWIKQQPYIATSKDGSAQLLYVVSEKVSSSAPSSTPSSSSSTLFSKGGFRLFVTRQYCELLKALAASSFVFKDGSSTSERKDKKDTMKSMAKDTIRAIQAIFHQKSSSYSYSTGSPTPSAISSPSLSPVPTQEAMNNAERFVSIANTFNWRLHDIMEVLRVDERSTTSATTATSSSTPSSAPPSNSVKFEAELEAMENMYKLIATSIFNDCFAVMQQGSGVDKSSSTSTTSPKPSSTLSSVPSPGPSPVSAKSEAELHEAMNNLYNKLIAFYQDSNRFTETDFVNAILRMYDILIDQYQLSETKALYNIKTSLGVYDTRVADILYEKYAKIAVNTTHAAYLECLACKEDVHDTIAYRNTSTLSAFARQARMLEAVLLVLLVVLYLALLFISSAPLREESPLPEILAPMALKYLSTLWYRRDGAMTGIEVVYIALWAVGFCVISAVPFARELAAAYQHLAVELEGVTVTSVLNAATDAVNTVFSAPVEVTIEKLATEIGKVLSLLIVDVCVDLPIFVFERLAVYAALLNHRWAAISQLLKQRWAAVLLSMKNKPETGEGGDLRLKKPEDMVDDEMYTTSEDESEDEGVVVKKLVEREEEEFVKV
jgi:hypothetical protein